MQILSTNELAGSQPVHCSYLINQQLGTIGQNIFVLQGT